MKLAVVLWVLGVAAIVAGCLPTPFWPYFIGLAFALNTASVVRSALAG